MTGADIERIRKENRRRLWQSMAEQDHAGFPTRIRAAVRLREAEYRLTTHDHDEEEDAAGHSRPSMSLDVYSHVVPADEVPAERFLALIGR